MHCLQRILGLIWMDRVPYTEILERSTCGSLEAIMAKQRLRWLGHVARMPDNRLPRQILYGQLAEGRRTIGGQYKRFKDCAKNTLKRCDIPSGEREALSEGRLLWRTVCAEGLETFEEGWVRARADARERRHNRAAAAAVGEVPASAFICPVCDRYCHSRIGLHGHFRTHAVGAN
jgi:hypothetical protein